LQDSQQTQGFAPRMEHLIENLGVRYFFTEFNIHHYSQSDKSYCIGTDICDDGEKSWSIELEIFLTSESVLSTQIIVTAWAANKQTDRILVLEGKGYYDTTASAFKNYCTAHTPLTEAKANKLTTTILRRMFELANMIENAPINQPAPIVAMCA
jgi:hypothetical protein